MTAVQRDDVSPSAVLLSWLGESWRRIKATGRRGVLLTFLGTVVGIVIALMLPPSFTSEASFVAQGASTSVIPSALLGIAASVGLGTSRDYSPQFYADLLTSDPVVKSALSRRYTIPGNAAAQRTYLEIEGFADKDSAIAQDAAIRHLRRRISSRADVRTNVVYVNATARYATLSRDLVRALLDALDSMNISFRQEQSRELRQFFEGRVAEAQHELDSAETELRQFLERNRVANSPLLIFEQNRLTRTTDLKRAVYTTVVQQYEEAKMQESRNVPVLTVLTQPTAPVRKSGPPRRFIVVIGFLGGLLLALGFNAFKEIRRFPSNAYS